MWEKPDDMDPEDFRRLLCLIYGAYMQGAQDTLAALKDEANKKA